jgi:putative peptidoglycan lipid II flippase
MIKKVWHKLNNSVAGGAVIIAFFSLLAKILALFRERLIAINFGASAISDVYYASFRLPDLIFNTLVLGALSSAFIPIFQRTWHKDKIKGLNLANSLINLFLIIIGFFVVVAIIFTPQITKIITPGFSAWQLEQIIVLSRIMLLATLFFVVSNVLGGVLNAWKRFFSFSLAAAFYNIGIILGIILLYPRIGLVGLAWGVVIGAVLHLLVQIPESVRHGFRYRIILIFDENLKKILKLMLPRTLGLAAGQLNLVFITMMASHLSSGSLAVFNLANNLQSLPISLFAVSLAIAVFPTFSQALLEKNHQLFALHLSQNIRRLLFLLLPISVLIVVLRAQLVRVILGAGNFTWENTYDTAQTLGWFAISIFAQGLIPLLARSFYALEDTKTPTKIAFISIVINISSAYYLVNFFGVLGLAMAFSISSIVNMLLLYLVLYSRIEILDNNKIFDSLLKITLSSLVAGFFANRVLHFVVPFLNTHTFWGIFWQGMLAGLAGLLIYLILSILLKLEEVSIVKNKLSQTWRLLKNGKN